MPSKLPRVMVYLSQELYDEVARRAQADRRPMSNWIANELAKLWMDQPVPNDDEVPL